MNASLRQFWAGIFIEDNQPPAARSNVGVFEKVKNAKEAVQQQQGRSRNGVGDAGRRGDDCNGQLVIGAARAPQTSAG